MIHGRAVGPPGQYAPAMRFNLLSISVVVAVVGCLLFTFGGFMLFPVALDMWERGSADKHTA